MCSTRQILAAGIVRDIEFISEYALDVYLAGLDKRGTVYKVLETWPREDDSVICRIVQQYNASPLIQLYKED